jgi:pilus assembly protein CpaB
MNRTVLGQAALSSRLFYASVLRRCSIAAPAKKSPLSALSIDVGKGDAITADQVETVDVGAYYLPSSVLKTDDQVIGQYATVDLKAGDFLLSSKLSGVPLDAYLTRLNG